MESFLSNISIKINDYIYIKDPESSELGKRIIEGSVNLIDEIGFEAFTFKKLANYIGSTEASIYRYFENKNKILLYLTAWYWGWIESKLILSVVNVDDNELKLKKVIYILTEEIREDSNFSHIDEVKLHRVIYSESAKAYLNKFVDDENKHGVYACYKRIISFTSDIILAINKEYPNPKMLVSTIIVGAQHQRFYSEHLPGLTNEIKAKNHMQKFYFDLAINSIINAKQD
ncbi:MAG: TetR/AcrR family transcriptional regulator [Brumimicrobium sp.]|nr:TetR/AcrR family transcriptional regulator [Brumimicrobium sp.]